MSQDEPAKPGAAIGVALTLTVALAVVLRRWGWESWSFWLDESLQLFVASQPTRQILALLRNERNHPPLDYLAVHLALKVSASALFLRWWPTLVSAATLPLVFLRAGGSRRPFAALGAAFSLAVLPLAVHQGQELRAYALALFAFALADVARARHEETGRPAALGLQALASVAAVYSLYIAFFPLAVTWALDAAGARRADGRRARRRLLLVPAITVIVFLPWLAAIRSNLTRPNEIAAPALTPRLAAEMAVGFVAERGPGLRYAASAAVVWGLAGLGLATLKRPERARLGFELVAIVVAMVVFLRVTNHWFELRYFWFALWPLTRLLGEGLGSVERLGTRFRAPAFAGAAALLLVAASPGLAENARWGRVDWRPPAGYLTYQSRVGRGGPVIPADWWSYMLLNAQRLDQPGFELREPVETRAGLGAVLGTVPSGWIVKVKWGGSELGKALQDEPRPWATFARADDAAIYRFENGRIVPP